MRVCYTHGGAAPQAREAARLRLVFLLDPALRCLAAILKDPHHPQVLGAIKEVLARNELYGFGVEHETAGPAHVTVNTQINAFSKIRVESLSDEELSRYERLLVELRELEEPKTLPGTRGR